MYKSNALYQLRQFVFTGVAAGAMAMAFIGQANAVSMSCSGDDATFTLSNATNTACFSKNQVFDGRTLKGNDKQDLTTETPSTFPLFNLTGWIGADANDDGFGDNTIQFASGGAPVNGTSSGSWTIDTLAGKSDIAIVLKIANNWGAFLLDLTVSNPLTGNWSATKVGLSEGKNLSHATIYYRDSAPQVPVPAALPLMLTVVAGTTLLARRRRAG